MLISRPVIKTAAELRPYYALFLTSTSKNAMLNSVDESAVGYGWKWLSLHSAYSTTGTNELSGGSYQRSAVTWATASGGAIAINGTPPAWSVPASTAAWVGLWDDQFAGSFGGMAPVGGGTIRPCSAETAGDISSDDIFALAHGYTVNTRVVFWGAIPGGISVGTVIYYVVTAGLTTDSFRVSTQADGVGSTVNLTGTQPFNFFVQSCTPEVFAAPDVASLTSFQIDLSVLA